MIFPVVPYGAPQIISSVGDICMDAKDSHYLMAWYAARLGWKKDEEEYLRRAHQVETFALAWQYCPTILKMVTHVW